MKPILYTEIKNLITQKTAIRDVMLYRMPNRDLIAVSPLIMVEFSDVSYENMTHKKQEVSVTFTLHLLCDALSVEDDEAILQHTQDIFVALTSVGYIRRRERSQIFDENTIDYQITFEAPRFEDTDAQTVYHTEPRPPLNITT